MQMYNKNILLYFLQQNCCEEKKKKKTEKKKLQLNEKRIPFVHQKGFSFFINKLALYFSFLF